MRNLLFLFMVCLSLVSCSEESDVQASFTSGTYEVIGGDLLTVGQDITFKTNHLYLVPDMGIPYKVDGNYIISMDTEQSIKWKFGYVAGTLLLSDGGKQALLRRN